MEQDPNPTNPSQNEINDTSVHSNNQIEQHETPRQDESQALETEQQAEITPRAQEEPENDEEEENNDEQNEENQEDEPENDQQEEEQNEKEEEQEENEVEAGKDLILDGLANAILGEDAANAENKGDLMNAFGQALLQPAEKNEDNEQKENDDNNEKNEEDNQEEPIQPAVEEEEEEEEEQEKPKEEENVALEDVAKTPTKSTKSSSQGKRHFDTKEQETPAVTHREESQNVTHREESQNVTHREESQNVTHREESQNVTPRGVESKPKEEKPVTPVAAVPVIEEVVVIQEPVEEPPKFASLQEAFKSISDFFSTTQKNIDKTSPSLFSKLKEVPALMKKKAQEKPKIEQKQEETVHVQHQEEEKPEEHQPQGENASKIRTIDEHNLRMQRMKEMKKNFENQVNDLNKGLENLERHEANLEGADDKPKKLGPLKAKKSQADLPLFMKMEKEFQEKQVLPELERRKVELKAKRELYKPMDEKAIREHALKYQEFAKKDMLNRQVARLESDKSKAERVEKAQKLYKSVALNKILEQEKEQKVKDEKRFEEIKQKKDKQLQYGKLVKEIYFPKVEQKNEGLTKETIRQLIERSERVHASPPKYMPPVKNNNYEIYPAKTRINRISQEQVKQFEGILDNTPNVPQNQLYGHKGYLYRKAAQKRVSPPHKAASAEDKTINKQHEANEERGEEFSQERGQVEFKKKLSPPRRSGDERLMRIGKKKAEEKEKSPEPEVEKKSYPNYLEEIKKKRVEQERKGNKAKYVHWEKTMKNKGMSKQEKMMTILDEVGRLEHQMKIKEEKLKAMEIPGNMNPMELEEQVGEMYLESIKAKLAIIKGFAV